MRPRWIPALAAALAAVPIFVASSLAARPGAMCERAPLSFLAVGDIMLARNPGKRAIERGYGSLFDGARDIVASADIAFANLETSVTRRHPDIMAEPHSRVFRADPATLLGLKDAGFDLVSIANNHMSDGGSAAIGETREYLRILGIAASGAGKDLAQAREPAIVESGGWKVALLSCSEWDNNGRVAGPDRAGTAPMRREALLEDIAALRAASSCDLILVSVHWGAEYAERQSAANEALARDMIDAGAAMVIGHHPHVLQGMELRGRGLIVYSLGNFVFDIEGEDTTRSGAVLARFDEKGLVSAEFLPMRIALPSCAPAPAIGADATAIAAAVGRSSARYGTELLFADDRASIRVAAGVAQGPRRER